MITHSIRRTCKSWVVRRAQKDSKIYVHEEFHFFGLKPILIFFEILKMDVTSMGTTSLRCHKYVFGPSKQSQAVQKCLLRQPGCISKST